MKRTSALTLIEILIVVTLLGIISFPLYLSYAKTQSNQGLRSSTEQLTDNLKQAHIFAREAKDQKAWGVKSLDSKSYALINGSISNFKVDRIVTLERNVTFESNFETWFDIGTGERADEYTINIINNVGLKNEIHVYPSGLVEIKIP